MKKRWTAILLALVLSMNLLPAPARAADAERGAGGRLTGVERAVYDCMKTEITQIAQGAQTSTKIKIPDQNALSWPLSELGSTGTEVEDQVEARLAEALDVRKVFECLSLDCPYELFWRSDQFTWGYSISTSGGRASVRNLTFHVEVAQDYRGGDATSTDAAKIAAANKTLANAQAIIEKYQDLPDYDKLAAYREEICRLVDYNSAARNDIPYGNPWQMIYVFDADPDTNVVCEGYAKAFQYLCDHSQFQEDVVCCTVSGVMNNGSHMWNIVRMGNGKNYLVDVTNCDSGAIGADDKLFLVGALPSEDERTYTVINGGMKAVYTCGENQVGLYVDGCLEPDVLDYLADLNGPGQPQPSNGQSSPFTDVAPEAYYAGAVAWAVENGITNGTSDTTFSPDQTCTQAEVLTFLWRAAGRPESGYSGPVGEGPFWQDALLWCSGLGMIAQDAPFDASKPCTRASAVSSIWWVFGHPQNQVASFTDVPPESAYAYAVGWAVLEGVTNGVSDTAFDLGSTCTRGQIVTFLYRAYCQRS